MLRCCLLAGAIAALSSSAAQSADLPVDVPASIPLAVYNWTGAYVGGHVGGRWVRHRTDVNDATGAGFSTDPESSSVIGGLQAGYNWQMTPNLLIGVEADVSYGRNDATSGIAGTTSVATVSPSINPILTGIATSGDIVTTTRALSVTSELDWTGSLRARLGFVQDRALFFVTGGLAVANTDISIASTTTVSRVSFRTIATLDGLVAPIAPVTVVSGASRSQVRAGWTAGGGIEWAFDPNWTVRGEYLYADYGRTSVTAPDGTTARVRFDSHVARIAVNYRFGAPPVAVVEARY